MVFITRSYNGTVQKCECDLVTTYLSQYMHIMYIYIYIYIYNRRSNINAFILVHTMPTMTSDQGILTPTMTSQ